MTNCWERSKKRKMMMLAEELNVVVDRKVRLQLLHYLPLVLLNNDDESSPLDIVCVGMCVSAFRPTGGSPTECPDRHGRTRKRQFHQICHTGTQRERSVCQRSTVWRAKRFSVSCGRCAVPADATTPTAMSRWRDLIVGVNAFSFPPCQRR